MSAKRSGEQIASGDTAWENTPMLRITTRYFKKIGWELLPTCEGLILNSSLDREISFDFPSIGAVWRWWRTVHAARVRFLHVIGEAVLNARWRHGPSCDLVRWLATPDSPYPPMMNKAYSGSPPTRLSRGWLRDACQVEQDWPPGTDPLDLARAILRDSARALP